MVTPLVNLHLIANNVSYFKSDSYSEIIAKTKPISGPKTRATTTNTIPVYKITKNPFVPALLCLFCFYMQIHVKTLQKAMNIQCIGCYTILVNLQ